MSDPARKPTARMRAIITALTTLVTITVTTVVIGVVSAGPASAHTALRSASPADGASVRPPAQIVLTYNEPVQFTRVLVTDAAGRQYQSGRPVNVDNTVTENIASPLPNGRYTVAWRVVASDGHPVEGTYQFTVSGSAASAPAAAPPAAAPGDPAGGGSSGTGMWWIVLIILLIAAAGGAAVLLRQSTKDPGDDPESDAAAEAEAEAAAASPSRPDTEAGTGR
ncbi:MAG TPA: copper resistance CopC family protein [Streptosporangiaceae bacterium]|nr:copper resistance CopC family protein [Streptosporangiaceae bacterium]